MGIGAIAKYSGGIHESETVGFSLSTFMRFAGLGLGGGQAAGAVLDEC